MKPPFKVKFAKTKWSTSVKNVVIMLWWAPFGLSEMIQPVIVGLFIALLSIGQALGLILFALFTWIAVLCGSVIMGLLGRLIVTEANETEKVTAA